MSFLPTLKVLLLIDLPILLASVILALSLGKGPIQAYEEISAWRMDHPAASLPSLAIAGFLAFRWRRRRKMDDWVLPPEERIDDTLEYEMKDLPRVEICTQKFKMVAKLPWRVRLREWRRRRKATELQLELEKLHQEYLEGALLRGTDLREDQISEPSYSRFPPKILPKEIR